LQPARTGFSFFGADYAFLVEKSQEKNEDKNYFGPDLRFC